METRCDLVLERFFIDGDWIRAGGGELLAVTDSATGEEMGWVADATEQDIAAAVAAARSAAPGWAATPVDERAASLRRLGDALAERVDELAELEAREIGTPLEEGRESQVLAAAQRLQQIPDDVAEIEWESAARTARAIREPVGVVAGITAWNFPLQLIAAKVGAALAAGCTIVVKTSEVAPLSSFVFAEEVAAAGLPAGVVNVLTGYGSTAGEALVSHPGVAKISFTGSVATARRIAATAAPQLTPLTLELGGKSASVVLDDADLPAAVRGTIANCFQGCGQTCDATTRLLVPEHLLSEAEAVAAAAVVEDWPVGPPLDPGTKIGPLVSAAQMERVDGYISIGRQEGARLLAGGSGRPPGQDAGYFVRPTVFTAQPSMRIAREEIFGPVLTLVSYRGGDGGAVAAANDSPYGLGGAVWSADPRRAEAVARRIHTGHIQVNGAPLDLSAPFGGFGSSGYGRENGRWGIEEFSTWKSLHH